MKKGCLIAAFCTAATEIVLLTSSFWHPIIFSAPDIVLICANQYDSNQICQVNSTFYHTENSGVFCGEQCVLPSAEQNLIDENDGILYVCNGQKVTGYNSDLQAVCSYTLAEKHPP